MTRGVEQIYDAKALWDVFQSVADFGSNVYDEELLQEITVQLKFGVGCNIGSELVARKTTVEELLSVLLKALKPFSIMLNDLLAMFVDAGAKYTDNNLQIKFNFERMQEDFNIDLSNFRVYKEEVENVVCSEFKLENSNPWNDFCTPLRNLLDQVGFPWGNEEIILSPETKTWVRQYRQRVGGWPTRLPKPWFCGIDKIDSIISELWELPKVACETYNKYYQARKGEGGFLNSADMPYDFCVAETDYWIGFFVEWLYCLAYQVGKNQGNKTINNSEVEKIEKELKKIRERIPLISVQKNRMIKKLLDILNFPVWKKRYAMYSAWVATQIVSAFDKREVRYNVVDGGISFSFGGSVIAYIKHDHIKYTLFAELKTAYSGVTGHGRKNHIQPDYSLCVNDEQDPNNTVLAVECKQYKIANKKNFNEAIIDYAGGRPNAQIVLVNYTSVPESFRAELTTEVSERVPFYDKLVPGDASCNAFKRAIKEALPKKCEAMFFGVSSLQNLDILLKTTDIAGDRTKRMIESDIQSSERFRWVLKRKDRAFNYLKLVEVLCFRTSNYVFYLRNNGDEKPGGISGLFLAYERNASIVLVNDKSLPNSCCWKTVSIDHQSVIIYDKIIKEPDQQVTKEASNDKFGVRRSKSSIEIRKISITELTTDAVVNAANSRLQRGTGVCGYIFQDAGVNEMTAACNKIGHCDVGDAVITPGFNLSAKFVIHAVGPQYTDGKQGEPKLLYSAYKKSLLLAMENGLHSIGFPLISAGIYGYPLDGAWRKAIQACQDFLAEHSDYEMEIVFAVLDDKIKAVGEQTISELERIV